MYNGGTYLTALKANQDFLVSVDLAKPLNSKRLNIRGYLISESLQLSSGASYDVNSQLQAGSEMAGKALEAGANKIMSGAGNVVSFARQMLLTHANTIKLYTGSNGLSFSLTFRVFRNLNNAGTWREIENTLLSFTQPVFGISDNVIESPFYSTKSVLDSVISAAKLSKITTLDGKLVSVMIGSWFSTPAYLNVTGVDRVYSIKLDKDGKPQYVDVTMNFEPYRATDADESNWLQG